MITVHVIMSGIVSFIPYPGSHWTVKLQEAPGHQPSLVVENAVVYSTNHSPDAERKYQDKTHLVGWVLGLYPIDLTGNTIKGDPVSTGPINGVLAVQDGCDTAECAYADKGYAGAAFDIFKGTLGMSVAEGGLWKFADSDVAAKQVAEEICWNFKVDGSSLKLKLQDARGNPINLELRPPPGSSILEIRLQNMEKGDIFPMSGINQGVDKHATFFFAQSKKPPSPPPPLVHSMMSGWGSSIMGHWHRLAGVLIGEKKVAITHVAASSIARTSVYMGMKGLRVNCPPAQWVGGK